MNKFAVLVGIVVTVVVTSGLVAYATYESDVSLPTQKDARDVISEFGDDVKNSEIGYGQLEKQDGAYSP